MSIRKQDNLLTNDGEAEYKQGVHGDSQDGENRHDCIWSVSAADLLSTIVVIRVQHRHLAMNARISLSSKYDWMDLRGRTMWWAHAHDNHVQRTPA